jgi:uncharacterized protein YcbX
MKIAQLYTYPIKSLRPAPMATTATLTPHGFPHDRTFMLIKRDPTAPSGQKNMHVPYFPEMTLFMTAIEPPSPGNETGKLTVRYNRLAGGKAGGNKDKDVLEIPLVPNTDGLETLEVTMHSSPAKAYDMGARYNTWFSERFGFEVTFAYLGGSRRKVLGSLNPNGASSSQKPSNTGGGESKGWMSSITKSLTSFISSDTTGQESADESITFADVAAYLVCTTESLHSVSARLPPDSPMDIEKFRPNIVLSGAPAAWDEDFWAEIQIGGPGGPKLVLTSNCARCKSINIDFSTGAPGEGATGEVLKRMQSDRRIDKGSKYSPIFGRYGFLVREDGGEGGREIRVGDEVGVTRRNGEHTTFGKFVYSYILGGLRFGGGSLKLVDEYGVDMRYSLAWFGNAGETTAGSKLKSETRILVSWTHNARCSFRQTLHITTHWTACVLLAGISMACKGR